MKLNLIYLVLALFFAQISLAQDGLPIYSDYFADNYYLLHPSMAGAAARNQVRLTARQQWFDSVEAPNLQTASINARVGESSGIGAIIINDQNGYHSQTGGYITYAHHLMFSRSEADLNQLSFGLSAGLIQSRLDDSALFDPENFDPIIADILQSGSYFNVDAGLSYNFLNFSGHFTIKNLIFQNRALNDPGFESNNQRNYLLGATYAISGPSGSRSASDWAFEPGFLFQWRERTNEQNIDVNFKAYRMFDDGKLFAGISYRRSFDGAEFVNGQEISDQKLQYITPVLGGTYKNFMFAYTYSYLSGNVRFNSGGFHQITLGLDFLSGRREPYSCNCPAIN
jgi:type IX secretion system PorP/SprF family membrane protein